MKKVIDYSVKSGKSPVQGKRWKKYSKGYSKIKGKERPVDMTRSGEMRNSLKAEPILRKVLGITFGTKANVLRFFYDDEKANYHDVLGAGRIGKNKNGKQKKVKKDSSRQTGSVVRRLIPYKNGERFNKTIEKKINKIFRQSVAMAVRKLNQGKR